MKLPIIKSYKTTLALFIFIIAGFIKTGPVNAATVPTIDGYVYNWQTRAPIANVWVKWTYAGCTGNNCDCQGISSWPSASRYTKTNNQGHYVFADWQNFLSANYGWGVPITQWGAQWNTRIDTNRDGVDDAFLQPAVTCNDGHQEPGNFGCYSNPHTFTVVRPAGWTGTFDTLNGVTFENDTASFDLPHIFYRENNAPQPTNTPGGPTNSPTPTPNRLSLYTISGSIFLDTNTNGTKDPGEPPFTSGHTVIIYNIQDATNIYLLSDTSGNFSVSELEAADYSVRIFAPTGYRLTTPGKVDITLGPNARADFGIAGLYTVTGKLFVDQNNNLLKETSEPILSQDLTINAPGGIIQTGLGTYQIIYNTPGQHTISLTSLLPPGYKLLYPLNGPPPTFTITLEPGNCKVDTKTGAVCESDSVIANLNFPATNSIPWIQSKGMNMRFDNGITNFVAASPQCYGNAAYTSVPGSSNTPGILFTGDRNAVWGQGGSSARRWLVGGSAYPEVYKNTSLKLPSSYKTVSVNADKANVTLKSLSCDHTDCDMPNSLPAGIYKINGDLKLSANNQNVLLANSNYIFLVQGNLTINGNIHVPVGSTALFTASGNIIVTGNVGHQPNFTCAQENTPNLQGIYSADNDFIVEGVNNCPAGTPDRRLIIEGAVFVNAALTNGNFENNRNLCGMNTLFPSILFIERYNLILNLPNLLKRNAYLYQEQAP